MPKVVKTRKQAWDPIFGSPLELSRRNLPSYEDVMRYFLLVQQELNSRPGLLASFSEIAVIVTKKVIQIWKENATIECVLSEQRIIELLKNYHKRWHNIKKLPMSRKSTNQKISDFQEKAKCTLFDICKCNCRNFVICKCQEKVPLIEQEFLIDQRTSRNMIIGNVDLLQTHKRMRREKRLQTEEERHIKAARESLKATDIVETIETEMSDNEPDDKKDVDVDFQVPSQRKDPKQPKKIRNERVSSQMTIPLPTVAKVAQRTGVSLRSAALIATAALTDSGLITEDDTTKVIDHHKLDREAAKLRKTVQKKAKEIPIQLKGLYFDGRKDSTLTMEKCEGKWCRKTIMEQHYVMLAEPTSSYIGHVIPVTGHSAVIASSITDYLAEKEISMENLVAVGCDGTVVNTGVHQGVIKMLEKYVNRPLHWFVCQLHANELPFRHLLQYLDGTTAGPNAFSGPIGKKLATCETMEVIKFEKISQSINIYSIDKKDLSTDQLYLKHICQAVAEGQCTPSLAKRSPGKMTHSRWLTTANRVLRLYIATNRDDPLYNSLRALAEYIMKVYSVVWFMIKTRSHCTDGAKNLWHLMKSSRYLPEDLRIIVDPVIQRNGYFGNPENILLGMMNDDRKHIRTLAFKRILRARKETNKESDIRTYSIPPLNFKAENYIDIVDWSNCVVTEPPITAHMLSDANLERLAKGEEDEDLAFHVPKFPCHTQAVERVVKMVTEASAKVCGKEKRDGHIRVKIQSRNEVTNFNTKSDYRVKKT